MDNKDIPEKDFLTVKEFAFKLGVHPNTIRRSIKNGRISGFRVGSGKRSTYLIAKTEVNRLALFDMEELINKVINERNLVGKIDLMHYDIMPNGEKS